MLMRNPNLTVPQIKTELPGPKARKIIAKDERATSPSYTREYPLVVSHGLGAMIDDVDGNRFLDFTAGIAVCSTGHCHPLVVEAIKQQASQFLHMSGTDFYYQPQADLANRLAKVAPGKSKKRVFFTNSGAESVEAAIKLARYHTKRQRLIAFTGAFHGRTMGAVSLTASKSIQREGFGPLVPGVTHIPYANCGSCPVGKNYGECAIDCVDTLENLFRTVAPPEEVAAIVVEPIQGEGGYIVPPSEFHPRLKALAEQHGILYVVDEVQAGMGRTGKMFAIEHWGVEPDIICTAKGIASGMPLGAIIAKEHVMDWPPGAHASTFGGNPISCAAALATLDLLEDELIENAKEVGDYLIEELQQLADRHLLIGDVRGKGLMVGMDVIRADGEPDPVTRDELIQLCFANGLLLLGAGRSTIRFCPPLVIDKTDVDTAISILDDVLGVKGW